MGDRGQVYVRSWGGKSGVYLYTHYGASSLDKDVERAIAKGWRWDDPDYLARIIFDEMVGKDGWGEETGYGIGTQKAGDIWRLVTVDCKKQTVTVEDESYQNSVSSWKVKSHKTFAQIKLGDKANVN